MSKSERFFLANSDEIDHAAHRFDFGEQLVLAAIVQRSFELCRSIEVIEDRVLSLRRHDDELVESGVDRFLDSVLQDRLIDERQHFLRNDFRRRKEARAEAGAGENAGAEFRHVR